MALAQSDRQNIDRIALWLTGITAAVHLLLADRYDFFGDELYFIVCGQHPAFGYADQPPAVPLLCAALYAIDPRVWLLRLPAVASAAGTVWVTIALTRRLGGDDLAAFIAGIAAASAPLIAGLTAVITTSTFEPLAWTVMAYALIRAIDGERRAWLWAGLAAGLALEAKYALVVWLAALAIGLLLTPQRVVFRAPSLWLGLLIALFLAAPSLLWQADHGWPFIALMHAGHGKNIALTPLTYISRLTFGMQIPLAPVWIAGVAAPFIMPGLRRARALSVAFVIVLTFIFLSHGKDYYAAPAFPTAFAIGAIAASRVLQLIWLRIAFFAAILVSSAAVLPLALPILSPAFLIAYETRAHLAPPRQFWFETGADLPMVFGFQFGWHDFVAQVASAYRALPADQRNTTSIMVDDYAEAAAIDLYGPAYGLPPALSGHNQYRFWALRGQRPVNVLFVRGSDLFTGYPAVPAGATCASAVTEGITRSRYAMAFENGKTITFCAGIHPALATLWPGLGFMY